MAALRIDGAPKDDMPAEWSMYPGGLGAAPLAATQGVSPIRVARVRATAQASQVLELGLLGDDGRLRPQCEVARGASFKQVAVDVDREGSLWIAYTNASGTWIEQRSAGL